MRIREQHLDPTVLLATGRRAVVGHRVRFTPGSHLDALDSNALALAQSLVVGPTFAHGMTKTMLHQEWAMTIDQAIEAEAQAQAICMQTQDFHRAFHAFAAKQKPVFEGN